MSLPSCVDSQETTVSHRFSILNIGSHKQNIYIGKNFFDGNNYQSILICLDGGKFFFFIMSTSFLLILSLF